MNGSTEMPSGARAADAVSDFAEFVHGVLEDKRATDVVWLDLRGLTDIADDFLIATITNSRQGVAIFGACEQERKQRGLERLGMEGEQGSSWMLLDYGDLIIHLFQPEQRAYYALEHIWADARRVK